jgi:magnesium chelatase family protein
MVMPGDMSRAHHGILCLDELPECRRRGLEVLRQSCENRITKYELSGTLDLSPSLLWAGG